MGLITATDPTQFSPAYNPQTIVWLSDKVGQSNFKYVFNITINGQTVTVKQSPRPDGYGVLDVHRIVENFLTYDFDTTITTFALNPNSWVSVIVDLAEEYDGHETDPSPTEISYFAFNAYLESNYQWSKFDYTQYQAGSLSSKFLTNAPRTQYVGIGQHAYLHFMNSETLINSFVSGFQVLIKLFNSSGTQIGSAQRSTTFHSNAAANLFQRIPVGYYDINNIISLAGAASYTIQLLSAESGGGGTVPTSEIFAFIIDPLCSKFDTYRFHFLNQLGGFDAFNFKCKDTITTDIVATTFERTPGTFSSSGFIYNQLDRGVITTDLKYTDKITVESDWITDVQAAWLKELYTSPAVFWEDGNGNFIPVTISSTSYETKKSNPNEKLHNISIQFTLLSQNRQRF